MACHGVCNICSLMRTPPPTPPAELLAVQSALERAFPQCSDLGSDPGRGITAFTPHLSLGQWRMRREVQAAAAQLAAGWSPLSFEVAGVGLLARQGFEDPFRLEWFVPLHGGDRVAVGAPYIATVGDSACKPAAAGEGSVGGSSSNDADRWSALFGIGATQAGGSVWQFAYGANMCPRKLNGARGLHPLESLPASLPGWRLSFNHRGGKLHGMHDGCAGRDWMDACMLSKHLHQSSHAFCKDAFLAYHEQSFAPACRHGQLGAAVARRDGPGRAECGAWRAAPPVCG